MVKMAGIVINQRNRKRRCTLWNSGDLDTWGCWTASMSTLPFPIDSKTWLRKSGQSGGENGSE